MSAKNVLTWSDTYANFTSFITSFGKAVREGDVTGAANACLDLSRTIIIDGMNIAESVAAASPIDAKTAGNAALIVSTAAYADTMHDSYSKDSEKTFVKKQIGGFIGIFSSTAQFFFEENYDIYDVGSYLGLSDSHTMADNVEYLKGKSVDDWMRLFGLNQKEAEKAKAAVDAIPKPEEEVIDPISGETNTPSYSPPRTFSDNMSPWWSSISFSDFASWASSGNFNRDGNYYNYDPLVLDLDGDGIELIDVSDDKTIYFDHDNDGIKTKTSWINSDDGFLVMDRNNDGIINNGAELFGDSTKMSNDEYAPNGFVALTELDSDNNGIINSLDINFSDLKIWKDINSDGMSQSNELISLDQAGIAEIDLSYIQKDKTLSGDNIEAQTSHYVDSEGNQRTISDLNFSFDTFHRQFSDYITLTDEQSHQLNLGGSGTVRDLREAATLSPELNTFIENFKHAKTKEEQISIIPSLVLAWAKTSLNYSENINILPAFQKTSDDGTKIIGQRPPEDLTDSDLVKYITSQLADEIAILDAFSGMGGNIYYTDKKDVEKLQSTIMEQYAKLCESIYRSLIIDTRLQKYYDELRFDSNYNIDLTSMISLFEQNFTLDPMNAFIDLGELLSFEKRSDELSPLYQLFEKELTNTNNHSSIYLWLEALGETALTSLGFILSTTGKGSVSGTTLNDYIYSDSGNNTINADAGDDVIWSGVGNDTLNGNDGDDWLDGGDGNDKINGNAGQDTLDGGAGDDTLNGGDDADTYVFRTGHGHDTVTDNSGSAINRLVFEGAQSGQLLMKKDGNNLVIQAFGTDDAMTVKDFFSYADYRRFELVFDDRTMTMDELHAAGFPVYGTDTANTLRGWNNNDTLYGYGGNDSLYGGTGNDILDGGDGDDRLDGEKGQDTLTGGAGNDALNGGTDADTYIFRTGHGQDNITDSDTSAINTLVFEGAQSGQLLMKKDGNNLVIQAFGTYDAVTVKDFFSYADYRRFELVFDDRTMTMDELHAAGFPVYGTDTANTLRGWNNNDTLYGYGGNDSLYGYDGNDILDGGAGNDSLIGGGGSDTYKFYEGHGKDTLNDGASSSIDKLIFEGAYCNYVSMEKKGYDLVINAYRNEDSITIAGYFSNNSSRRLELHFEDETITMEELPEFVTNTLAKNDLLLAKQSEGMSQDKLLSTSNAGAAQTLTASTESAQLHQLIDAMATFGDSEGGTGMISNTHQNDYRYNHLTIPQ